jgi:hypothetical protein
MRKRAFDEHGDQSPNPWDFTHSGRNNGITGWGGKPPRCSSTASGARVPSLESPILRGGLASVTPRLAYRSDLCHFFVAGLASGTV